jgi:hypothetical protein
VLTFSVVVEIPALAGDGERDDDDSAGDDDDSAGDDDDSADDDDSVSDDDDSATDDDDSATDDDDSATDDDDSATDDDDSSDPGLDGWEVSATFRARWSGDAFACETVVSVEGTLFAGEDVAPADCLDCAGLLLFDPSTTTVQDNDCENAPAEPELLVRLLTDPYDEGLGDFLDLALMRADTMEELGIDLAAAGGWAAEDLTEQLAEQDLDFTHAGFVNAFEGSMLDGLGADAVMTPPQDESDRLGFWAFGVHTDEPPPGEEGYPGLLYGVTTFQIAYY